MLEKPRLLKVMFTSIEGKPAVLCNKNQLRKEGIPEYARNVYMTPDLTSTEQESNKNLRQELNTLNKDGKKYMIKKQGDCDTLLHVVDKYVPFKHVNPGKHLSLINKLQMKQRKSSYDKAKQTQMASDWRAYRKASNQVNKASSVAHQYYCTHLFDDNNKRFQSLVKKLRKNHQTVPSLCANEDLKTSYPKLKF